MLWRQRTHLTDSTSALQHFLTINRVKAELRKIKIKCNTFFFFLSEGQLKAGTINAPENTCFNYASFKTSFQLPPDTKVGNI